MSKIDQADFKNIVAFYWCNERGEWEGVINKRVENNKELRMIRSQNVILLLLNEEDFLY